MFEFRKERCKMKLFKIFSLVFVLIMTLSITPIFAFESENLSSDESMDNISQQAKIAIDNGQQPAAVGILENKDNGLAYDVNVYEIPLDQNRNYSSVDDAQSMVYYFSTDDMKINPDTVAAARADGTFSDSGWDETHSLKAYLGFDFNRNADGLIQLTRTFGNYSVNSNITITNNAVLSKQFCPSMGVDEHKGYQVQSNSFEFNSGFTKWVPDSAASIFGSTWFLELQRGSKWGFNFYVFKHMI